MISTPSMPFSANWAALVRRAEAISAKVQQAPPHQSPTSRLTERHSKQILHHMVNCSDTQLNRTFSALADPTRRALLERVEKEPGLSISELARPLAIKLPAVMKHLDVLADAGLVERRKTGRTVTVTVNGGPLEEATQWLKRYERFWSERLDRLAAFAEKQETKTE